MNIAVGGAADADPAFRDSVLAGLAAEQKCIASKWLYDEVGSRLFDVITVLPEYYPTRIEAGILRERVGDLAAVVPEGAALIELGSGSSAKTRILLDAVPQVTSYVPVDISAAYLHAAAQQLASDYPGVDVHPVVADFTRSFTVPPHLAGAPKLLFFPGSTIGNFAIGEAEALLRRMAAMPGVAAFVVGVDLKKDPGTLVRAYDDAAGVTAAFNLNLLGRLNRELGADFDLAAFGHEARWNVPFGRIEMHLVSRREQRVTVAGEAIRFRPGETIHTENSHKYDPEDFGRLALTAGWRVADMWVDDTRCFSVQVLRPALPS